MEFVAATSLQSLQLLLQLNVAYEAAQEVIPAADTERVR